MRLTIIVPDNVIYIDGTPIALDLAPFAMGDIHAVQWIDNSGWIEYADGDQDPISNLNRFMDVVEAAQLAAQNAAPKPPALDEARAAKLMELRLAAAAEAAPYIAEYPEFETDTWPSQEAEARAWQRDNATLTPTISGIMATRNLSEPDRAAFVAKIIQKADLFRKVSSRIAGKRQRLAQMVEGSQTVQAVQNIKW